MVTSGVPVVPVVMESLNLMRFVTLLSMLAALLIVEAALILTLLSTVAVCAVEMEDSILTSMLMAKFCLSRLVMPLNLVARMTALVASLAGRPIPLPPLELVSLNAMLVALR